jgi:hypothetical protein
MSDLRSKMIRLAASMPKGSTERKALLDVLKEGSYTWDELDVFKKDKQQALRLAGRVKPQELVEAIRGGLFPLRAKKGQRGYARMVRISYPEWGEATGETSYLTFRVEDALAPPYTLNINHSGQRHQNETVKTYVEAVAVMEAEGKRFLASRGEGTTISTM